MSDLVNRLRGHYVTGLGDARDFSPYIPPISLEAANEIERLEAEIEQLKSLNVAQLHGFDAEIRWRKADIKLLLKTLKRCYQKHVQDNSDIGWDELCDEVSNALCEIMGDVEFQTWVKS